MFVEHNFRKQYKIIYNNISSPSDIVIGFKTLFYFVNKTSTIP